MKNHLKYLISLILALAVMTGDGILCSQSNAPEYYQSSYLDSGKEIDLKNIRLYVFNRVKSFGKTLFPILLSYLEFKELFSLHTKVLLQVCNNLHQNIISFIKQSVFINEHSISTDFRKSLYNA
ncbi:hypothetical protein [Flavobacterium salmonis]|uniref:Uncharacterized protein n=1 Tax=Flavobacterium salmonis TaxID=2654844 RepID=A0A6V6YVA7_9FLAO|nr:hypothetical protein [Flavobacterium salmonis]CAD0003336.1 hypothetical protein FLAT13_01621 [Flavobacterium salmonis]